MATVKFPSSCNERAIFDFCSEVESHAGEEKVLIDFSSMGRIEPFVMVYIAKHIRDFNRNNKQTTVSVQGTKIKNMQPIWHSLELSV